MTQSSTVAQRIDALLAGLPQSGNELGAPAAPVTLQYFGDLQCPTSKEFTLGALPFLVRQWVRTGTLRIEYRSLQAATRDPAVFAHQQVAALAAGMQNRLWYYIEFFYHEQQREDSGYVTAAFLQHLAAQTPGLNAAIWVDDVHDPLLPVQVATDQRTAARHGMSSTPSFLIGHTGSRAQVRLESFSPLEPQAFSLAIEHILSDNHTPRRSGATGRGALAAAVGQTTTQAGGNHARITC